MKWVIIKKTHINTNLVETFYWCDGRLIIAFVGEDQPAVWEDPDRKLYLQLCRQQGIRPYEEEENE